ncbi:unnamed protein product [Didymodactylos carnosus]|uniref:Uncharacterized protein n=1 Tax=Didymodactylos carnosus TaxID=1234261 RepID=A0A814GMS1_9BILA|nr:unnamed protein product [Didymodactylos carnosus]CAF0998438.1 unnamed protein product [Didymodactylos carnosus]CAF3551376.1 unnamed protein product [Didymodactylos carnosus]CAF3769861.1 unnamed protein product [Didymodactylos carnosus]
MDSPCRVMVNVGTQAATNNRDLLPLSNEAFLADFTTKSSISDFNCNDNRRYSRPSDGTRMEQITIQPSMGVKPFLAPDSAILQIVRSGNAQQESFPQQQYGSLPQQHFNSNNGMFNNRRRFNNTNGYMNNQNFGLLGARPRQTSPNRSSLNRRSNNMYADELNPFQQKNRFQQQQQFNNNYSQAYDNRMNVVDQLLAASRPLPVSFKPQAVNSGQSSQYHQQTRPFINRRPMSAQQEQFMHMNMQQQSFSQSNGGYFLNNQRSNRDVRMNRNAGGMWFDRRGGDGNNRPIMRTNYNNSYQDQYYSNNDGGYNYNFDIFPYSAPFRPQYNNSNYRRNYNNINNYQQANEMRQYWYGGMQRGTYQRRSMGRRGATRGQLSRANRNSGYGRQRGVAITNRRGRGAARGRGSRTTKSNRQQKSPTIPATPNANGTSPLKTKTNSQQQKRRTKSKRKNRKQGSKDNTEVVVCNYIDTLLGQLIVEAVSESLSIEGATTDATTTADENKKSKKTKKAGTALKTNTSEWDGSSSSGEKEKRTVQNDDEKLAATPTENNDEWHDIDKDDESDSSSSSSSLNHSPNLTMTGHHNSEQTTTDKSKETALPPRDKTKDAAADNKRSLTNEQKQPSLSPSASDSSMAVNVGHVSSLVCPPTSNQIRSASNNFLNRQQRLFNSGSTACEEQKSEAREGYEERCEPSLPWLRNRNMNRNCPDINTWNELDVYEIGNGGGFDLATLTKLLPQDMSVEKIVSGIVTGVIAGGLGGKKKRNAADEERCEPSMPFYRNKGKERNCPDLDTWEAFKNYEIGSGFSVEDLKPNINIKLPRLPTADDAVKKILGVDSRGYNQYSNNDDKSDEA